MTPESQIIMGNLGAARILLEQYRQQGDKQAIATWELAVAKLIQKAMQSLTEGLKK